MNILCMGGRTVGPAVAWDLVQTFLRAGFSQAERHLRRLEKWPPWKQEKRAHKECCEYAPTVGRRDYVALEPMTASASALMSGSGLRLVPPGGDSRRSSGSASMRSRDGASLKTTV